MGRITPPQLLVASFLFAVLLGAALLSLPAATTGTEKISLVDSLFTATSAVCVTGLTVKDTGTFFSPFGKWVIFGLFQVGGLGIMTFSTLFAVILGRNIGFRTTDVISSSLDKRNIMGLDKLLLYIVSITFAIEMIGALLLFARWRFTMDWTLAETIERSIFHSVAAFCNAGFSLFSNSLENFRGDAYINIIVMALIFTGGIGFVVIMDGINFFLKKGPERRVCLQTRVVLTVSIALILAGAAVLFLCEYGNAMKNMSLGEKVLGAFFQSVTSRTAGFNTLPIGGFSIPSLMFIVLLMFIGASPGSTGGGVKTSTLAVIVAIVFSSFKNNSKVKLFNRSVPRQVVREAMVIVFLAVAWIFALTFFVVSSCRAGANHEGLFLKAAFEVVSAFGTVGLSTGITPSLNDPSKIGLILSMFVGRVGLLTLALAVAFRKKQDKFIYPEETIMVG